MTAIAFRPHVGPVRKWTDPLGMRLAWRSDKVSGRPFMINVGARIAVRIGLTGARVRVSVGIDGDTGKLTIARTDRPACWACAIKGGFYRILLDSASAGQVFADFDAPIFVDPEDVTLDGATLYCLVPAEALRQG